MEQVEEAQAGQGSSLLHSVGTGKVDRGLPLPHKAGLDSCELGVPYLEGYQLGYLKAYHKAADKTMYFSLKVLCRLQSVSSIRETFLISAGSGFVI